MYTLVLLGPPLLAGLLLDTKAEVEAIIARAALPYSGVVTYDRESEWPARKNLLREDGKRFTLSGENWVLASLHCPSSVRSVFGLFAHAFSGNRLAIDGIQVEAGRSFPDDPPNVAGTLWYSGTRKFLQNNLDKAIKKGCEKVGDYNCNVYEWRVPKDQVSAFGAFTSTLQLQGGLLRLYAAPSLGYSLPRIEYLSTNDTVEASYNALNFKEHAAGLFLPTFCKKAVFAAGQVSYSCTLEKMTWEYVNEEIPDSAFKLHVPFRTIIVDLRGNKRQFRFESVAALPDDLRVLFSDTPIPPLPPPAPKPMLGIAGWLGIGAGAVILLFLLVIFLRRSPAA